MNHGAIIQNAGLYTGGWGSSPSNVQFQSSVLSGY